MSKKHCVRPGPVESTHQLLPRLGRNNQIESMFRRPVKSAPRRQIPTRKRHANGELRKLYFGFFDDTEDSPYVDSPLDEEPDHNEKVYLMPLIEKDVVAHIFTELHKLTRISSNGEVVYFLDGDGGKKLATRSRDELHAIIREKPQISLAPGQAAAVRARLTSKLQCESAVRDAKKIGISIDKRTIDGTKPSNRSAAYLFRKLLGSDENANIRRRDRLRQFFRSFYPVTYSDIVARATAALHKPIGGRRNTFPKFHVDTMLELHEFANLLQELWLPTLKRMSFCVRSVLERISEVHPDRAVHRLLHNSEEDVCCGCSRCCMIVSNDASYRAIVSLVWKSTLRFPAGIMPSPVAMLVAEYAFDQNPYVGMRNFSSPTSLLHALGKKLAEGWRELFPGVREQAYCHDIALIEDQESFQKKRLRGTVCMTRDNLMEFFITASVVANARNIRTIGNFLAYAHSRVEGLTDMDDQYTERKWIYIIPALGSTEYVDDWLHVQFIPFGRRGGSLRVALSPFLAQADLTRFFADSDLQRQEAYGSELEVCGVCGSAWGQCTHTAGVHDGDKSRHSNFVSLREWELERLSNSGRFPITSGDTLFITSSCPVELARESVTAASRMPGFTCRSLCRKQLIRASRSGRRRVGELILSVAFQRWSSRFNKKSL